MRFTAAVITVSDKGYGGERTDRSGPALVRMLSDDGWQVTYTKIIPDEREVIEAELMRCADELRVGLVLTTGGTGFAPRDVTPEATKAVIDREAPGIPEAMRSVSMKITPMGCLSRAAAGIRGSTLIVNLPGSEKAVCECLEAVRLSLRHGVEILGGKTAECGQPVARVVAVCTSRNKGTRKYPVDEVELLPEHGIAGDAHAGQGLRQVSLLGAESVAAVQEHVNFKLEPGAFAENILTEGIRLFDLPVGTRLMIGTALCEVTQIGKECHQDCAIRKATGDCVMPREGVFVRVLEGGHTRAGDTIRVMTPGDGAARSALEASSGGAWNGSSTPVKT